MKVIYRNHEMKQDIVDGQEYWTVQEAGTDSMIAYGPYANQQETENFVDFHCDQNGIYPLECEHCFETKDLKRVQVPIWNGGGFVIGHDCMKQKCKNAEAYYFDLGKAMAKGEM